MSTALSIKELSCRYNGQSVVDSLNLEVNKGEIVCLLGASGCGKTTLLKAIAGLLPLQQGRVEINGRVICDDTHNIAPEKRNIGMIFQDYALFPHLTVAQNIAFGLKQQSQDIVLAMLSLVKLDGLAQRYPHQLSGGQQQRVAIARALAYKPDLLLLDEPFSNIDAQVRHGLIKEIRKIFKEKGVTAIFVTHSREEAFAFADKLAVMNHGVIEQYGTASNLYYQPSSRFVADFMGNSSYVPVSFIEQNKINTPFGTWSLDSCVVNQKEPFVWLLRPQHLIISLDDKGCGVVIEYQFMGDTGRYLIEIENQSLIVYSNQLLAIGDKVKLEVLAHQIVLFKASA